MAATKKQQTDFISKIAPCVQIAYRKYGKVLPSVCIGMACVETGYGTAKSTHHHSYLGQKVGTGKTATNEWGGKFFTALTSEEYKVGVTTIIRDAFRAYDSMQQCVLNYYELLNTKLYSKVKAGADFSTQMKQIKECKYMTSNTEVNAVLSIISKHNLTKYDFAVVHPADRVLREGDRGEDVKELQTALNATGLYALSRDGIFGPLTADCVRHYQKAHNLTVDGIVGKETKASLGLVS